MRLSLAYQPGLKRALDVAGALAALLLLAPLLAAVALAVHWRLGRPVLFRQTRPGLRERPFTLWKFRTMTEATGPNGLPRPPGERLTDFGRWLRGTSLDELPQLLNVLRGEMSLVGPRPLLPDYLGLYDERQRRRHAVRPGLTGLAQVRGRNAQTWEERLELDVRYVERLSFGLDLRILVATVGVVLARRGVSHPGHDTMPRFRGRVVGGAA